MSAFAHRSNEVPRHEYEWLDFSDRVEMSPASIWALDDEDEITIQTPRGAAKPAEQITKARSGAESNQNDIRPQVQTADESQVFPREESFATAELNHEFQPADFAPPEQVAQTKSEESSVAKTVSRPRILDESAVLPGEASFATVVLNREIQSNDVRAPEPVVHTRLEVSCGPKTDSPLRIIDEPDVLPGEVSFATVMMNEQNTVRSYSPMEEFHAKFKLNWKNLTGAAVFLFLLSAGVTLAILKIREANIVSSSAPLVSQDRVAATQTGPTVQTQVTAPASAGSVVASAKQKQASSAVISSQPGAKPLEKVRSEISSNKLPTAAVSETSRKAASEETNKKAQSSVSRQDAKSKARDAAKAVASRRSVTEKPGQRKAEDRVARKRAAPKKQERVSEAPAKVVIRNQSPPKREESAATRESEPRSSPSSGAQRPRTVTRKDP